MSKKRDSIEQPTARGVGHIAGARKHKYSQASVKKLAELGFDPIEKMVEVYNELTEEIADLVSLKDNPRLLRGGEVRRYSSMAHAQLLTMKQKVTADLLRYGYARLPETVNLDKTEDLPPVVINLLPKGTDMKTFNAGDF